MKIKRCSVALIAFAIFVLGWQSPTQARKNMSISVADDPSWKTGSPGLVLVEVSDFQCPGCGRSALEMMPQIGEVYVQNGKVELVFLDHPLQIHPQAFLAARAAACANDQGRFWEMHDELFQHQNALGEAQLPGYAAELKLDVAAFQKCLAERKHDGAIRDDVRTAEMVLGIDWTPAYLLGRRVAGGDKVEVLEILHGVPYEELEAKIKALLPPEPEPTPKSAQD
ncbi:MAG: DsbA family protein [Thermoanaerobaculia bacterium]